MNRVQRRGEEHQQGRAHRGRQATIGTNTTPTGEGLTDSSTLKRLLKPLSTTSVLSSPELSRRAYAGDGYISEPEFRHPRDLPRRPPERSRGVGTQTAGGAGKGGGKGSSPPRLHHLSHHPAFDHAYYATTPPSSSPDGDGEYWN